MLTKSSQGHAAAGSDIIYRVSLVHQSAASEVLNFHPAGRAISIGEADFSTGRPCINQGALYVLAVV